MYCEICGRKLVEKIVPAYLVRKFRITKKFDIETGKRLWAKVLDCPKFFKATDDHTFKILEGPLI